MTKAWVVMVDQRYAGEDPYPTAVFTSKEKADAFAATEGDYEVVEVPLDPAP